MLKTCCALLDQQNGVKRINEPLVDPRIGLLSPERQERVPSVHRGPLGRNLARCVLTSPSASLLDRRGSVRPVSELDDEDMGRYLGTGPGDP